MSSRPASARAAAATLPECEPPRMRLGAPIITAMPCRRQAAAASAVVGNSAMRAPWAADASTCASVASSWLASVAPSRRAASTAAVSWRAPIRAPSARQAGDVRLELVLVHRRGGWRVGAQLGDVGELPLTGRVVHEAEDADAVLGAELGELLDQGLRADLGAQVQPVADAQRPGTAQAVDLGGERPGVRR